MSMRRGLRQLGFAAFIVAGALVTGCSSDGTSGPDTNAPAAPTGLRATTVEAGGRGVPAEHFATIQLEWDQNSESDLAGHEAYLTWGVFSPDSSLIVTSASDETARVWDGKTGAPLHTLKGHTGMVSYAAFSADGQRIITGSTDKTAKIWDAKTGKEQLTIAGGHVRAQRRPRGKARRALGPSAQP